MIKLKFPTQEEIEQMKATHGGNASIVFGALPGMDVTQEDYIHMVRLRSFLQTTFKCQRCGYCCRVSGPIFMTKEDIQTLADYLGVSFREAKLKYTHRLKDRSFTLNHLKPCEFYSEDSGCKIYPARPRVCRSYPFLSHDKKHIGEAEFAIEVDCKGGMEALKSGLAMMDSVPNDPNCMELLSQLANDPDLDIAFNFVRDVIIAQWNGEITSDEVTKMFAEYSARDPDNLNRAVALVMKTVEKMKEEKTASIQQQIS